MANIFCANCGNTIPETAKFCPACGTPVQHLAQQQPSPYGQQDVAYGTTNVPQPQAPTNYQQPPGDYNSPITPTPPPKKSKGGIIALIVVLALAVLGGGGWALYKYVLKPKVESITDPISYDEDESDNFSFSTDESDQAEDFTGFFDKKSEDTDNEEEEYIEEECSRCNGTGKVRCTRCGGQGWYESYRGEGLLYYQVGCKKCGGAGSFHEAGDYIREGTGRMKCPKCGGTGYN